MFSGINPAIDVRMLRTLHLLLTERNVSRVAAMLGHTQPSVSLLLKRSREIFGDPLLVRSGHFLVVTPRGEDIRRSIEIMLSGLMEALSPDESFDPSTAQQRFRIAAVNCFGIFIIAALAKALGQEAPGILVDFSAPDDRIDLTEELGAGRIDVVIGNWPAPSQSLKYSALLQCDMACMVRAGHPLAQRKTLSLADYLEANHISPTPSANAAFSPVDGRLHQLNVQRRIAMSVPEYGLVPTLVAQSDLVFTTARPYAEYAAAHAPSNSLKVIGAPTEFDKMNLYLLWHERAHLTPANRWLRGLIKRVARQLDFDHAPVTA